MDRIKKERLLDVNVNVDVLPIAIIGGIFLLMYFSNKNKKDLKYV